jgi:hypothetical protein
LKLSDFTLCSPRFPFVLLIKKQARAIGSVRAPLNMLGPGTASLGLLQIASTPEDPGSILGPRGPSAAALESQHLASAVPPAGAALLHFQSTAPAHWAAGEFDVVSESGWCWRERGQRVRNSAAQVLREAGPQVGDVCTES